MQTQTTSIKKILKKPAIKLVNAPRNRNKPEPIKAKLIKVKNSRPATPHSKKPKKTKASMILTMLGRSMGACLAELTAATGWQPHSVRGFLSGTVKKRLGLELTSKLNGKGQRRYYLAASSPEPQPLARGEGGYAGNF